jgi:hypothetical protein
MWLDHPDGSPQHREGQRYFSPVATNSSQIGRRFRSSKGWRTGIDWQKMDEDFTDDFVWQRDDRILVFIEPPLHDDSLISQFGKRALKIRDSGIYVCETRAIRCKHTGHDAGSNGALDWGEHASKLHRIDL